VPLGTAGLQLQELNRDPETDARTAILVSPPRTALEHKAQYHRSEEEFYCLAGRFTFDGQHWFEPGGYACFPAGVVHGAHVRVPGGYRVYLRTSGDTTATPVAQPCSETPYRMDGRSDAPHAVQLSENAASNPRILRTDGSRSVERWRLRAGEALPVERWRGAPLEMLLVAGQLLAAGEPIAAPAYGFYPDAGEVSPLTSLGEAELLVHRGDWP
jgi:hypothetical protein